jgi:Flp pilus assembly CpaF family ATPase
LRIFIISRSNIYSSVDRSLTIGTNATDSIVVSGPHAKLVQVLLTGDLAGRWTARCTTVGSAVKIGEVQLTPELDVRLTMPAMIEVAGESFECRNNYETRSLRNRLNEWMHEIETQLHIDSVQAVQRLEPQEDRQLEASRVQQAVSFEVERLQVQPEFEAYLASVALMEILIDEVNKISSEEQGLLTSDGAIQAQLAQIRALIRLNDDNHIADKIERISVLVPWAIRNQPNPMNVAVRTLLSKYVLKSHLSSLLFGLGPIDGLRKLTNLNDILVLPSGAIFVERGGVMQDSGRRMLSPAVSHRIVERIVSKEGRRIDLSQPLVDARTDKGDRLNAVIAPISVDGPALTLRKAPESRLTIDDMVDKGAFTSQTAEFLKACVLARKSLVISGGTGSGKTTLLRELAMCVPTVERLVTIEDTAELMLKHQHLVSLQSRPANLEGSNSITIRDLVKNALRMRPDRVIIGECRGGETLDMLQAMNTGHEGSMTTIHSNSPAAALLRLETMALQAEQMDLPSRVVREQIASAVDVVIQIERVSHRYRRITSICEIVGFDEEEGSIVIEEIFNFRKRKGSGGITTTRLSFTGYVPTFFEALLSTGVDINCLR